MSKVYLVSKQGVEWNVPHSVWTVRKDANTAAEVLNDSLDRSDPIDSLSRYVVTPLPFYKAPQHA